jgi:hypothetical protein
MESVEYLIAAVLIGLMAWLLVSVVVMVTFLWWVQWMRRGGRY